jgi:mannose-6-phosphate isomerase-like protein (cupin superfamily)
VKPLVVAAFLAVATSAAAAPPAVFVQEADVKRQEPPPHSGKGMSTAYRISDAAPNRTMEFRKRVLHRGASIGLHVLGHDEVYYVLSGEGDVTSDGVTRRLKAGDAAYLYKGANVGIAQVGADDLAIIVSYPVTPAP